MPNDKFYEAQRKYVESLKRYEADEPDDELSKISKWLDEHGWDALGTPAFDAFLAESGIDKASLTISCCRMPDWA